MKLQETLEALEKSTKDLTKSVKDAKPGEEAKPEVTSEAKETAEAPKEAEPETPAEAPSDDTSKANPAGDEHETESAPEAQTAETAEAESTVSEDKADEPDSSVEDKAPVEDAPADDTQVEAEQTTEPAEETEKSVNIDQDLVMKSLDTLNLALNVIKSMSKPESHQDNMSKNVAETPDAKHTEDVNGGKQSSAVVKGADCDDPDMKDGKKKNKASKDDDEDGEVTESATKSADKDSAEKCDGNGEMSDDKNKDKEDDATKSVTGKAVQSGDAEDAMEKSDKVDEPSKDEVIKSFRKQVSDALDESDSDVMAGPNSVRSNKLREVLSEANKSSELSDTLKKSFFDIK